MSALKKLSAVLAASAVAATSLTGYAYADMAAIEAAAKAEGKLSTIALPHDWCGYGQIIADFKAKYPEITVTELNPDAGSADEIEAVKANKDNKGPQNPDVLDVGLAFGPSAKAEGLLQPHKVATWDEIPENIKDPEGHWYGAYFGVLSFVVNKDLVPNPPQDWADLLKPEYAGQVALAGDPRASNQAIMAVLAAGMSTGAAAGADAGKAGLEFFKQLNAAGNFVPVIGKAGTLAQGTTPIVIAWDYNGLSWDKTLAENPPVEVVIPKSAVVAGVYVQAINAFAPNPNAAKLWMEHIFSDQGQIGYNKGFCQTARFNTMVAGGKVPADVLAALPPADSYKNAYFPTLDEVNANKEAVTAGWDATVGADVK
ncbi:MAG: ABC transporter substrate-binding protein [Rhizobiaceae bacterium]|nr:ABC transporter substrate-binding protein [Rhizobiaceae bacterium]